MLRDWVAADFGVELVELTRVHEGADLAAEVWNGDCLYAVKWSAAWYRRRTPYYGAPGRRWSPRDPRTGANPHRSALEHP